MNPLLVTSSYSRPEEMGMARDIRGLMESFKQLQLERAQIAERKKCHDEAEAANIRAASVLSQNKQQTEIRNRA